MKNEMPEPKEKIEKGNEKKSTDDNTTDSEPQKPTLGEDYWERVADDVASGYTSENDEDEILNEDQLPDDHERGDE